MNAAGDEARTVWSREAGQADGLCLNRIVAAGDNPPVTESYDDRVDDRFREGDEWALYLPFYFLRRGFERSAAASGRPEVARARRVVGRSTVWRYRRSLGSPARRAPDFGAPGSGWCVASGDGCGW